MKALLKRKFLPVFTTTFLAYKQCLAHIEFSIIVNFLNKRMKKGRRKERNKESHFCYPTFAEPATSRLTGLKPQQCIISHDSSQAILLHV